MAPSEYKTPGAGGRRGFAWKVPWGSGSFGKVLSGSVAAVDHPPAGSPGGRDQPAHIAAAIAVGDGAAGKEARSAPAMMPATAAAMTPAAMPMSGRGGRRQRGTKRNRADGGERKFPQHGDLLKSVGAGLSRRWKGRRNGLPRKEALVSMDLRLSERA